ncbi:MAG: hypothetical protein LUH05_02195 [Candidatus Gastranaerophilales bacterium]|nr:hypothetical protein [Candidatus Gastranaerophilales bacterium]
MSQELTEEEIQIKELQEKQKLKELLKNSSYYWKDRYKIGFEELIAIVKDITSKAGYGTLRTLTVDHFTYES